MHITLIVYVFWGWPWYQTTTHSLCFGDPNSAVFLLILFLGMTSAAPYSDSSLDSEWEEWKMEFAKTYSPVGNMGTVQRDLRERVSCFWEPVWHKCDHKDKPSLRTCLKTLHYELKVGSFDDPLGKKDDWQQCHEVTSVAALSLHTISSTSMWG